MIEPFSVSWILIFIFFTVIFAGGIVTFLGKWRQGRFSRGDSESEFTVILLPYVGMVWGILLVKAIQYVLAGS